MRTQHPGDPQVDHLRIAHISTYPPRECGIATYCEDLVAATLGSGGTAEPIVVAMANSAEPKTYHRPVAYLVDDQEESDYHDAAELLNESDADLVSIQHEFGIFGGPEGRGLGRFLDHLTKPIITTLHTVVPDPSPPERAVLRKLAVCSERLVVMNGLAVPLLEREYGISRAKVTLIHHGAPARWPGGRETAKASLGLSRRRVLSTFGLVGPGKGLEYALAALPAIRERHPEVCYLIIGRTHPMVERSEKQRYRETLAELTRKLGVEDSVRFVNGFQAREHIARYLAATDVYLTPYLNPHQVCSGTLAYAVAAGKAIVSTPYLYARFLLGDDRGALVGFRDPQETAQAVTEILSDAELQSELEGKATDYGRRLYWPEVSRHFLGLCELVLGREAKLAATYSSDGDRWLTGREQERDDRHDGRGREAHLPGTLTAAD